jgi:hypothetical protein
MRLILLFIEFFSLTVVVPDVVYTPWSWRFPPSPSCCHGGNGRLTPSPPCHCGGNEWLPLPIRWIVEKLHVWAIVPYGEGDALRVWRLLLAFPVSLLFELYGLENWVILLLSLCYLFLDCSPIQIDSVKLIYIVYAYKSNILTIRTGQILL